MRKFTLSFLLGISSLFTAQSYEPISVLNSHPFNNYIRDTLKHLLRGMGKSDKIPNNSLIEVPKHEANEKYSGLIKLRIPEQQTPWYQPNIPQIDIEIPYCANYKYEELSEYEKVIFNRFNFEQNKLVTTMGIVTLINYRWTKQDGSMTVNGKTELLRWKRTTLNPLVLDSAATFKIETCPQIKFELGSIYIE